jgi:hypothetical protein
MNQDGRSLLVNAIEVSKKASFTSKLKNPFYKTGTDTRINQRAMDWKFYRSFSNGVLYIRLETSDKDKVIETYFKNNTGIYGVAPDGFAAEITEVPMLWFLELTHLDISQEEIEISTFSIVQDNYNNVPCHKITMKSYQDDEVLMKITGDDEQLLSKNRDNYLSKRVFLREFWIGQTDNLIYCRKHYNGKGALIFKVDLGDVDFRSKIPQSLFTTPENVQRKFLECSDFTEVALGKFSNVKKRDGQNNIFLCDSDSIWKENYAKLIKIYDSSVLHFSGYGILTLSGIDINDSSIGISYHIKQTSVNKDGGLLAPKMAIITKTVINGRTITNNESNMQEQCGTYTFIINDNGNVTKITDFKYAGERNMPVARGIGWSLFINRDNWRLK